MDRENQRTIAREVRFSGKALQTGKNVEMTCLPAPPGTGIIFRRTDIADAPEILLRDTVISGRHARRSTIGLGKVEVQTVEHFLAALWGLGIDNLLVDVNGTELPAADGSAKGFLVPLKEAGPEEQDAPREYIRIAEPLSVGDKESSLAVYPGDGFSVSYYIDYDIPCIDSETFEIRLDPDVFEEEIAPARTFCSKKEALLLLLSGSGRGGTLKNTLVLGKRGPLGTEFRFRNEPVRHKVLDLIGDLYMLGRPLTGKVVARKSGHRLNGEMARLIYERYIKK